MAHGTWETSILQRKTHHAWPHSPSATNGIAISDTVPTMTSRAWAGKQLQVLNAASEAQLLHNCIFTIIANVPARTDGALSTIIVTASVLHTTKQLEVYISARKRALLRQQKRASRCRRARVSIPAPSSAHSRTRIPCSTDVPKTLYEEAR